MKWIDLVPSDFIICSIKISSIKSVNAYNKPPRVLWQNINDIIIRLTTNQTISLGSVLTKLPNSILQQDWSEGCLSDGGSITRLYGCVIPSRISIRYSIIAAQGPGVNGETARRDRRSCGKNPACVYHWSHSKTF